MPTTVLKNTLSYTDHHLIREICAPLSKINTYGFIFMRRFENGQFIWLCNELEWAVDYYLHRCLEEKYSTLELYQLFIADRVDLWSLNRNNVIWQEGEKHFGFGNGISLYFKRKGFIDIFAFYTKKDYEEMNEFYISHLELLRKFSYYFLEQARSLIDRAVSIPLMLPSIYNPETLFQQPNSLKLGHELLAAIDPLYRRIVSSEKITERELACIQQCAAGKSAKQVADHLFLSRRTVETHLNNAKYKLGCANLSELIAVTLKYGPFLTQ